MIRLNDYQQSSVEELRQKSRAYLSVGALAVTAAAAFLAISEVERFLGIGAGLALIIFMVSAGLAVLVERRASTISSGFGWRESTLSGFSRSPR